MPMLRGCDEHNRLSATRKTLGFEQAVISSTFATSHRSVKTALGGEVKHKVKQFRSPLDLRVLAKPCTCRCRA